RLVGPEPAGPAGVPAAAADPHECRGSRRRGPPARRRLPGAGLGRRDPSRAGRALPPVESGRGGDPRRAGAGPGRAAAYDRLLLLRGGTPGVRRRHRELRPAAGRRQPARPVRRVPAAPPGGDASGGERREREVPAHRGGRDRLRARAVLPRAGGGPRDQPPALPPRGGRRGRARRGIQAVAARRGPRAVSAEGRASGRAHLVVTIGIAVTTVAVALVGFLEVRANSRSDEAAQTAQQRSVQTMASLLKAQEQTKVNYEQFLRAEEQRTQAGSA